MKRLQVLIVISVMFLFSQGCGRLAFPQIKESVIVNQASDLNGIYRNQSNDTSISSNTLWAVIVRRAGEPGFKPDFNQFNLSVKLEATAKGKINAQLYQGTQLIDQKELKGRIEDSNSFRLKQRSRNRGVPFIYMKLARYGSRLRKDDKGRLLVDVVDSKGKMIFILSGSNTDDYTFSYLQQ